MSITISHTTAQRTTEPITLYEVPKKRSNNPALKAFGAWLEGLRVGQHASREQISKKLSKHGAPLGGSTLAQYEKGTVWAPDPGVLWGLAKTYKITVELAIVLLKANRANPSIETPSDLLRHASEVQKAHPRGEPDAVTASRIRELEDRIEAHKVIIRRLRTVAEEALALTSDSDEGGPTPQRKHRSGGGD